MGLSQYAVIFVLLWVTLYATVYILFLSPRLRKDIEPELALRAKKTPRIHLDSHDILLINPFTPKHCVMSHNFDHNRIGVVIAARNEKRTDLLSSV